MSTYLNVPFSEKDEAKALGARWDAHVKQWFVPDGVSIIPFSRWLLKEVEQSSSLIAPIYLRTSATECWSCSKISRVHCIGTSAINELEDDGDPHRYVIEGEGDILDICNLVWIDSSLLAALKHLAPLYYPDFSKTQGAKVWMNHCEHCEAKLGDFFLHSEPGGAFFPDIDWDESGVVDVLLRQDGVYSFSGGFTIRG